MARSGDDALMGHRHTSTDAPVDPASRPASSMPTRIVAEECAPTHDDLRLRRQPFQPGRHLAVELDARPPPKAQVVRIPGHVESALAAQMNGVLHDPLQRQKRDLPGRLVRALCALRQWTAVHTADNPLQPPTSDVVVDGLGVDALAPQPWCIHHEARRNPVQKRFQPWRSLTVHNHQNNMTSKTRQDLPDRSRRCMAENHVPRLNSKQPGLPNPTSKAGEPPHRRLVRHANAGQIRHPDIAPPVPADA